MRHEHDAGALAALPMSRPVSTGCGTRTEWSACRRRLAAAWRWRGRCADVHGWQVPSGHAPGWCQLNRWLLSAHSTVGGKRIGRKAAPWRWLGHPLNAPDPRGLPKAPPTGTETRKTKGILAVDGRVGTATGSGVGGGFHYGWVPEDALIYCPLL